MIEYAIDGLGARGMSVLSEFDVQAYLGNVKTCAEILAYACAATFFLYKARAGYHIVNVALTVATQRSVSAEVGLDCLAVAVTLKKGAHGSLKLHDARVRATWMGGEAEEWLVGIDRLSYITDDDRVRRRRANMKELSDENPFLHLTPEEEATFSCVLKVPHDAICTVEAAVTGTRLNQKMLGQWRSSVVALPITTTK